MAGPLLESKFRAPRRRRALVARPRLDRSLGRGLESKLMLVSAPAGFGKTTLLAEWLAGVVTADRSVSWLSLDARDNDPAVFWAYLIAALKTATPEVGESALAVLQEPRSPIEPALTSLLNDLHAVSCELVLVLDDFHVIDAPAVHAGIAFLLEHLPPQIHLVIAGR